MRSGEQHFEGEGYLLHFVIVQGLSSLLTSWSLPGTGAVGTALVAAVFFALPTCIYLSRITYSAIEAPFLEMRTRWVGEPVAIGEPPQAVAFGKNRQAG